MFTIPDPDKAKGWLDLVAKSAYIVFVASAFVLFVPNQAAKQIHIDSIRDEFLGWVWIAFVVSGALLVRNIITTVIRLVSERTEAKRTGEKIKAAERKEQEILKQRLRTLNSGENLWILCCLYKNVQTMYARRDHQDAQSLINKNILLSGSGNVLKLPFHVRDDVWTYLLENRRTYLPAEWEEQDNFRETLANYERNLLDRWV